MKTAEVLNKDAFYDDHITFMSKISRQQTVIVGNDANTSVEEQSDVLGIWYYLTKRTTSCKWKPSGSSFHADELHHYNNVRDESSTLSVYVADTTTLTPEEQRKWNMSTFKLQLRLGSNKGHPFVRHPKIGALWDIAFNSDHRPILLSSKL
ncbi:hypothetical protein RB195_026545 [Necator americanus]|uniref:Uncharacterized protein n=1 Tax=Necator americanus TaxID=51031 RepID=A0ABR1EXD0_NECAM